MFSKIQKLKQDEITRLKKLIEDSTNRIEEIHQELIYDKTTHIKSINEFYDKINNNEIMITSDECIDFICDRLYGKIGFIFVSHKSNTKKMESWCNLNQVIINLPNHADKIIQILQENNIKITVYIKNHFVI
jgi:hypothetical protein